MSYLQINCLQKEEVIRIQIVLPTTHRLDLQIWVMLYFFIVFAPLLHAVTENKTPIHQRSTFWNFRAFFAQTTAMSCYSCSIQYWSLKTPFRVRHLYGVVYKQCQIIGGINGSFVATNK